MGSCVATCSGCSRGEKKSWVLRGIESQLFRELWVIKLYILHIAVLLAGEVMLLGLSEFHGKFGCE
jgi:hypothetical protein